ncbi:MAG: glycoside hydrolase family 5 protein [Ardenticatenaceae bacterium]|nr:glycoside hydrolase family 5 protein [Ardenticatenaceae bacterium]
MATSGRTATPGETATAFFTATPTSSPTATPLPPEPTPTALTSSLDTTVGAQIRGSDTTPDQLSLAYAAGIRWVHIYLSWKRLEPKNSSPENFAWQAYDSVLADLSARGFQVIVNIDNNPSWAASSRRGPIDRTGLDEFEQFIGAVAQRYHQPPYNLHHYEFYTEPDDWASKPSGERGAWGGHGAEYAQMLARAHRAIHAVDPAGKVILGGLAYETWQGCEPSPCFDLNFLPDVIAAGGGPFIDILNFHYYNAFAPRYQPANVIGKALRIHELLPLEDRSKPIICTEIGEVYWKPDGDSAETREFQARFLVKAFAHIEGARVYGLDMPACTWFSFESYMNPRTMDRFGLLDETGTPLPSYYALRTFSQELPKRPVRVVRLDDSRTGRDGYEYVLPNEDYLLILWTENPGRTTYDVPATHVRVVSMYGEEREVFDGQVGDEDGRVNGAVRTLIGGAPVFIRILP